MEPVVLLAVAAPVALVAWLVRVAGWRFTTIRLAQAFLVVILVTFATTWLLRQSSADPCVVALGTGSNEDSVAECRDERHLDENVVVQYQLWAGDVLSGDLGISDYRNRIPLTTVLSQRLGRTVALFIYSQVIALALALPFGIWAAYQAGKPPRRWPTRYMLGGAIVALGGIGALAGWGTVPLVIFATFVPFVVYHAWRGGGPADRFVSLQAFVLLSIPVFVLGETLRYWFSIRWSWYDLDGYISPRAGWVDHLQSIWLPALVLGLAAFPIYVRLLRADMVQNLQEEFVVVAKAKGLPPWWILVRHVLRPSSLTLLTVAGLNLAQLVNGAIVIEFIYDIDGLGAYLVESVLRREYLPVQTIVAIVAAVFVLANTVIDLVYTAVDPRVHVGPPK